MSISDPSAFNSYSKAPSWNTIQKDWKQAHWAVTQKFQTENHTLDSELTSYSDLSNAYPPAAPVKAARARIVYIDGERFVPHADQSVVTPKVLYYSFGSTVYRVANNYTLANHALFNSVAEALDYVKEKMK